MEVFINLLVHGLGAVLCLVIGCVFLATSISDGVTAEEKQAEENKTGYLLRYPVSMTVVALLIIVAGAAVGIGLGFLPAAADAKLQPVFIAIQAAIGLACGIVGGIRLRKAIVQRILVEGSKISVHPARGKAFVTDFKEIRSVKKNSDSADNSSELVLRTNDREKIEVDNRMSNFSQFASQVSSSVELPNLAKKRRRKAEG